MISLTLEVSERDHIKGPPTAPVTLVEYGDYGCPYCAQAYLIITEVQERLGPKLRFVFRNFPITKLRPHSYEVALAAEGAAAQNMYWEMYDYLFKHGQTNNVENLIQAAASLGLEMEKFNREFHERTHSDHLDEDIESGKSSGVTKTPTLLMVIGTMVLGIWIAFSVHLMRPVSSTGETAVPLFNILVHHPTNQSNNQITNSFERPIISHYFGILPYLVNVQVEEFSIVLLAQIQAKEGAQDLFLAPLGFHLL